LVEVVVLFNATLFLSISMRMMGFFQRAWATTSGYEK
jgi:hypothetical protein